MRRTNNFRTLSLSAILALSAPLTGHAAPGNTGGAAEASELSLAQPMAVTRGSVLMAEQKGDGASATGNPLASQVTVAQYLMGDSTLANHGDGAVPSDEFGRTVSRALLAGIAGAAKPR
jgi:hypothetical protein